MATRSTIGKLNEDNSVTSVYCHWDGYPAGVGATLQQHYTDPDKIDRLLRLGDISILAEDIGTSKQNFDDPIPGVTLFYGRDRNEADVGSLTHHGEGEWMRIRKMSGCEYAYLWDGTQWTSYTI